MWKQNLLRVVYVSYFAVSLYIGALICWTLTYSPISFLKTMTGKLTDQLVVPSLAIAGLIVEGYVVVVVLLGMFIRSIGQEIKKQLSPDWDHLWHPQRVVKFPRFDATNQFVFHVSADVVKRAKHKKIVLPRKLHSRTEGAKINAKDLPALNPDVQSDLEDLAQTIGYQAIARFVEAKLHNSQERKDR